MSPPARAGEVKEFGFRDIPDDGPHTTVFAPEAKRDETGGDVLDEDEASPEADEASAKARETSALEPQASSHSGWFLKP